MQTTSELAFFEQLANDLDYWADTAVQSLTDPRSDLTWSENPDAFRTLARDLGTPEAVAHLRLAIREILRGQIHSVLVAIDGGAAMAETTALTLRDQDGHQLREGLNEFFFEHLVNTGRL